MKEVSWLASSSSNPPLNLTGTTEQAWANRFHTANPQRTPQLIQAAISLSRSQQRLKKHRLRPSRSRPSTPLARWVLLHQSTASNQPTVNHSSNNLMVINKHTANSPMLMVRHLHNYSPRPHIRTPSLSNNNSSSSSNSNTMVWLLRGRPTTRPPKPGI